MDWDMFWTAFGAIGGAVGAIATAAAVIVALWQTKYSQQKKVKLRFCDNISIWAEQKGQKYVGLTVVNIGNRDIIIQDWGIKANGVRFIVIPHTMKNPTVARLTVELPHNLKIEESVDLVYSYALFKKQIAEMVTEKQLKPSRRIRLYFRDSTGKEYTVKSTQKAKDYVKTEVNSNA